MTKTLQVPASPSTLNNTLLFVITDPVMRWETAARAAELIALNLRTHQWLVEVGAVDGSTQQAEQVVKEIERARARIETAWANYLKSLERDGKELRECIEEACTMFREVLARVDRRTAG